MVRLSMEFAHVCLHQGLPAVPSPHCQSMMCKKGQAKTSWIITSPTWWLGNFAENLRLQRHQLQSKRRPKWPAEAIPIGSEASVIRVEPAQTNGRSSCWVGGIFLFWDVFTYATCIQVCPVSVGNLWFWISRQPSSWKDGDAWTQECSQTSSA